MGRRNRLPEEMGATAPADTRPWLAGVIAIALFLFLVPIPLGSNRPIFWAANSIVLGLIGLGLLIVHRQRPWLVANPAPWASWFLGLYAAICAYLWFQTVPLPWLGPISAAPGATVLMLMRWIGYGLVVLLSLNLARSRNATALLLDCMVGAATVHALAGLFMWRAGDTILGLEKWAYIGSATGTFVNRNSFATLLAMGCVLAASLIADAIPKVLQKTIGYARIVLLVVAFVILVTTLLATHSRAGFAVTLLGLAGVALCNLRHFLRLSKRAAAAIVTIVPALLLGLILLSGRGLIERLAMTEESWNIRNALYDQIWTLITMRPLTGFGGGAFEIVFPLVHADPVGVDRVWDKAHSTYLALWADLGLIFGTLPLVMVGLLVWRCCVLFIQGRGHQPALVSALSTIVLVAAHSLLDFSLEIEAIAFWCLVIVSLGLGEDFRPRLRSGRDEVTAAIGSQADSR